MSCFLGRDRDVVLRSSREKGTKQVSASLQAELRNSVEDLLQLAAVPDVLELEVEQEGEVEREAIEPDDP